MMSLTELRRAVTLLEGEFRDARLERVIEPVSRRLVLSFHNPGQGDAHVLLCADPDFARLSRLATRPASPASPSTFVQLARARLGRARLERIRLVGHDRLAALAFRAPEGTYELRLAIQGPRTNVYLLDGGEQLLGALRPLAETRPELELGAPWRDPPSRPPREGEDRFAGEPDASFFEAVETAYARLEREGQQEALRRRIERALRRAEDALARKLRFLDEDARGAEEAERARRHGELLKSVLAQVRPGDREARARDFATGEEVVIPLDPTSSPAANLDALFRRGRKGERRALRAAQERGVLEQRREELSALRAVLDAGEPVEALAERPEMRRLLDRFAPGEPRPARSDGAKSRPKPVRLGKQEIPRRLLPRRYRSSDGLEIWVGRSDEGNDLLTTRLARGNDLFFHVQATPGSHVILRTGGKTDPPSESLLEACELAVHASRQRNASRVDVCVAPVKQVRKPKGAKPGLVLVTGGKTVHLRRDPRRLQRVLDARIDEAE